MTEEPEESHILKKKLSSAEKAVDRLMEFWHIVIFLDESSFAQFFNSSKSLGSAYPQECY